jgi:type II secretory pathway component GspD/PulD (secretin)
VQTNLKQFVFCGLILALAGQAVAQPRINAVSARKVGPGVEVTIEGEKLARPKTLRVNGNRSYMLEFDGHLTGNGQTLQLNHGGLKSVRSAWFKAKPPKVRVHFNVDADATPTLAQSGDNWVVSLNVAGGTPSKESFPETVPPLSSAKPNSQPSASATASSRGADTMIRSTPAPPARTVSLDFINTDVVQILKALAMQANVNIITAPEVQGTLTVSLERVTVPQALDFVTTLAGIRYAQVGNTYIVTPANRFADTMRQINGKVEEGLESRVVPLYSGEGTQIKASVLSSIPRETASGSFEIVLPSEQTTVERRSLVGGEAATAAQGQQQPDTLIQSKATTNAKDDYAVLIGPSARLNEVERMMREIDKQICKALGITNTQTGNLQKVFEPKGIPAEQLMRAVKDEKIELGDVQMLATPSSSLSKQVIVLSGRASDVSRLYAMLENMDNLADLGPTQYEVVGLKFIRPAFALVEVTRAVPGIRVNLLPSPVDPKTGTDVKDQAQEGNQVQGQAALAANQAGGQNGADVRQGNQVKAEGTTNTVPMKLLLFGTRQQIDRAREHLALIDMQPRQVAIELRVMEMSREEALKVGLDWNLLTGGTLRSLRVNQGLGTAGETGGVGGTLGFAGGGTLGITGLLDQISTRGNLIARPNILTQDGVASQIFVGDEVRYIETIQPSQFGTTVTTNMVQVGVRLDVLARVGDGGNIVLDLSPEMSLLRGFTPVPGGGQLPQTSVRRSQTTVNIQSGDTLALGGLIQDQDRLIVGGIPILRDLPIVGHLFRRTDRLRDRREIVFFLTVVEVTEQNQTTAADPRVRAAEHPAEVRPLTGRGG